jgi:hypothetical protein
MFGTWDVQLVDLSQTGARLDIASRPKVRTAVLTWLGAEVMGEVVWRDDHYLGMVFDEEISIEAIVETRKADPSVITQRELTEAARIWVTGSQVGTRAAKPRAI